MCPVVQEWQNPPCQFAEPTHDSGFSYLGVPAEAGMSYWYENDLTRPREWPHTTAPGLLFTAPTFVIPTPHSSFRRRPESSTGGEGTVAPGLVLSLGSGSLAHFARPASRHFHPVQAFHPLVYRRRLASAIPTSRSTTILTSQRRAPAGRRKPPAVSGRGSSKSPVPSPESTSSPRRP